MEPRDMLVILVMVLVGMCEGLGVKQDQQQRVVEVMGEEWKEDTVVRRKRGVKEEEEKVQPGLSSVFNLNDSHLHLMVHWAGKGSSLVFCLARDQEISQNSTSRLFTSQDYGTTFVDVSDRFQLIGTDTKTNATINKFFHHPHNNCYYIFTDILHKHIFVTLDCGKTVNTYETEFTPSHVDFDEKFDGRFLVHERDSEKRELFVTKNYGETFSHAGDFIRDFYWHHTELETVLFVSREEPSGLLNVLSSSSFFERQMDTRVVFRGAREFEMKGDLLFAVTDEKGPGGQARLHVSRAESGRFVVAQFPPEEVNMVNFFVAEVTDEGGLMVIVNHGATHSNLYTSVVVGEYEVKFSLSLERIMYYHKGVTWRESWLEKLQENSDGKDANFADFYRVAGLRGVYMASQLAEGVEEKNLRPSNLTTLITFDGGAEWQPIQGPKTDHNGNPVLGCYQDNTCSLHIAQKLSRKYPTTRSIPVLTSAAAPGIVLASGNMGHRLGYKTSVFLSADAGLSWHQVLQGNYYYNVGDHGGIIVAAKYFKSEGNTNTLLYSIDEGLSWHEHKFYPTPIRIFGLITEPGENTTVFTMFGTDTRKKGQIDWIIVKVDLSSVFKGNCTDEDYKPWSPAGSGQGKAGHCVLGRREIFTRRAPLANCYNGLDFNQVTVLKDCPCSHADYQCDFGFKRDNGDRKSACIQDPEFEDYDPHQLPVNCPPNTFYERTKGYIRVAGDQCSGGLDSRYEPEKLACPLDLAQPRTFLLIAQRKRIVKLDLTTQDSKLEELPLLGIKNVIAMDFDYETDCVFWADIDKDHIVQQCLNNSTPPKILAHARLSSVEGMSFDHISKILYFVDGSQKTVELLNVYEHQTGHQNLRKTILSKAFLGEKSKPRGIVVHPTQGYLFYSDWADKAACIGRAHLDGSNHTVIIDKDEKTGRRLLGWPNGLTIDPVSERVYFVDAQKDFLASCNLDGGDFKKVVSGRMEAAHPFAVAVFKGLVIWNDWTRKAIFQADKNNGAGIVEVQGDVSGAMDMKVYSPWILGQENGCSNHTCSHLCIARPPNTEPAFVCLCPDGMKAVQEEGRVQCRCPDGQEPLSNGTCHSGTDGKCGKDRWLCGNGLCVAEEWKCDGTNDCGDDSDEVSCKTDQCRANQFQCANRKCVPKHWTCDFENDCGDESDEKNCPNTTCDSSEFRCQNGQCINRKWRCDQEKDCQDGSDELNCTTTQTSCDSSSQLQCQTGGACLPQAWRCDGDVDCPDGSDEDKCEEKTKECQDWQFQCDNGHCIFNTWRCDGDHDCVDFSDEANCEDVKNSTAEQNPVPQPNFPRGECNEWMFKCASEQCIPFWWKCDGVNDCSDGSDEQRCGTVHRPSDGDHGSGDREELAEEPAVVGCPPHKFQCHNGDCIWAAWVCDKENDCSDGEDEEEEMCKNKVVCGPGHFQCGLSGGCVGLEKYCDGVTDCEDGTDESGCSSVLGPPSLGGGDQCDFEKTFSCDLGVLCVEWRYKCDGHQDCVDGSDEEMCQNWSDQVLVEGLEVDEDERTSTSLMVVWGLINHPSANPDQLSFKYSRSIHSQRRWVNVSGEWDMDNPHLEYRFSGLQPATSYDLRVFVRNNTDGTEFGHAPSVVGRTRDGVPSPPRNLTVVQKGRDLLLTWMRPANPNGTIARYLVSVFQGANLVQQHDRVVVEGEEEHQVSYIVAGLASGEEYEFEVVAENQESQSIPGPRRGAVVENRLGRLKEEEVTEHTVSVSWDSGAGWADKFLVSYSSMNTLGMVRNISVGPEGRAELRGLSPQTEYTVTVRAVLNGEGGRSSPSSIKVTTSGKALPVPNIGPSDIGLHKDSPTTVKLSWNMPVSDQTSTPTQFGVWYGVSEAAMISSGPQVTSKSHTATVAGLAACTEFLFVVAVSDPELGLGKMSNIATIATKFSPGAAPRNLTVMGQVLHWFAPCDVMEQQISYQLELVSLAEGGPIKPTYKTLAEVRNSSLRHEMTNLDPGSRYMVTVSVNTPNSLSSNSVVMSGPPIPPPTSVYAHPTQEGFEVSWAPVPSADMYEVILSPDPAFINRTCSILMPVTTSPLVLHPSVIFNQSEGQQVCREHSHELNVAVRAVTDKRYRSSFSRAGETIFALEREGEEGSITIPETSAVGTVVGVLVVMLALGAGMAYYAYNNRRMRSRFREFTAGHYSSATGSATINHSQLMDEDDESPIIRGFSDDEPLVM